VKRQALVAAFLAILVAPVVVRAQPGPKVWRIGVLATYTGSVNLEAFRSGMRDLGYVEGVNFASEVRNAEGRAERLPPFARELLAANVDLIVAMGTEAAQAAKASTKTTPIVMALVSDAVGTGLVTSLARPTENVTGLTMTMPEISAKRLQLLKELLPKRPRVTVLWNSADPPRALEFQELKAVAQSLGLTVRSVEIKGPNDLERALAELLRRPSETVLVLSDPLTNVNRDRIIDVALKNRTALIGSYELWPNSGALMSYGPDLTDLTRRSALHVDKILRGAKPADLPVEQPTKFELIVNLKTAKALGLTVPQSLLLRASRVIE
jgi:putative ABC transport system substrate-binding protein